MKLLINTEPLNAPLTGIGTYTYRLLEQFVTMPEFTDIKAFTGQHVVPAHEVLERLTKPQASAATEPAAVPAEMLKRSFSTKVYGRLKRYARAIPGAYRLKQAYGSAVLRQQQKELATYLYHEPNFIPVRTENKLITTIHDLSWVHFPEYLPAKRLEWLQTGIQQAVNSAEHILTVSELVREEIIDYFQVSPDRVHAVYLAADERFQPRQAAQTQPVLDAYGLTHGQYVLYVGTIEPRKRVEELLNAWEMLDPALRRTQQLVIAGGIGWQYDHVMERLRTLQAQGQLRYLDYVSHADLPFLLSGSMGFVFPAIYEGFGLPVLEAMASGVPVLCREGTSMAEFAEGAVLLHGNSTQALAEQLAHLVQNASLRADLIERGLSRASEFSWAKCARGTVQVYKQCL